MVHLAATKQICTIHEKIPTRLNVAVMLFLACFITYMLRVNMSINILAMVEPTNLDENKTLTQAPDYGPRYNWTASQQSLLLGSYFWGYLVTTLPGGMIAEWFGGKILVGSTIIGCGIVTALIPIGATFSFWVVYALRILTGLLAGVLYPALHNLISKWAPINEKGKFVSALLGGTFGTVITWPLAGILVETIGWVYAFYIPALIAGAIGAIWMYVVADSPADHPRISKEERDYIVSSSGNTNTSKKSWPPFLSLVISKEFWALLVLHYGNLWGLYFLLTAAPTFMSEVLGFNLAKAGFLASLPYLVRLFAGFIFGSTGDFLRKRDLMTVTTIRKFFCIFSHIVPGLLLMGLAYTGNNPFVCVTIITFSLGLNGASTLTNLANAQDLAPNYAGSVYGIINFFGTTTGFITPLVVGHFTAIGNTIEEWSILFIIGAVAYILPAIIFILFGSGSIQPWNDPPTKKVEENSTEPTTIPNTV